MTRDEFLELKKSRKLSVARLSELSGVPVGTITKIITRETKCPRPATMAALEKVLKSGNMGQDMPSFSASTYPIHAIYENDTQDSLLCERAISYGIPRRVQGQYRFSDMEKLPEGCFAELIDGCLYDMATPNLVHQLVAMEFYDQVSAYIRKNRGDCLAFVNAFGVFADQDDTTYLIPDMSIVCDPSKVKENGIYGAPDFVLEILSPSTAVKDKGHKFFKYSRCGVREYWIIDLEKKVVAAYRLSGESMTYIGPVSGKLALDIYGGELQIDLDKIAALIDKYVTGYVAGDGSY